MKPAPLLKGEIASLSTASDLQALVKSIKENNLESLNKIDEANITIQDILKGTNLESANLFKKSWWEN